MHCPNCQSSAVRVTVFAVALTRDSTPFDAWHCDACAADFDVLRGCKP